ncbi:MAG: heavy metal translocating P-type ATPase metal-binding domain-containing protein [Planctomycetes bacterium]|nr:heavy metal translocating P-type ATPase metal-binding domain-containing protein [Planctomycetota bacterium]MCB9916938.1 heavy metal translocating P-type ATPase metal-binding domain-containing protein [Planctomycetota bacterium]
MSTRAHDNARTAPCRHCGDPVPPGRGDDFCCRGCKAVWTILHDRGLDRFYDLGGGDSRAVGEAPVPARHDWLDEARTKARIDDSKSRLEVDIQGIHCAACVWVLQELWRRRAGALDVRVNPALGTATLVFEHDRFDVAEWIRDVESLGYRVGPARADRRDADSSRGLLIRLGVCVALAMNAMMFAFSHYFGLDRKDAAIDDLFRYLSLAIASAAVVVGGPVFFRGALAGIRRRVLHLDLPISLGIVLAYASSVIEFFALGSSGYFDTVTIFVALMLVGRYVQERAVARNRQWLLENDGAEHFRARRIRDGKIEQIPILDIAPGDELLLAAGDLVPVSSRLEYDDARFSLDWIRGESEPETYARDASVPAGAFLAEQRAVRVRAIETVEESGLLALLRTPQSDREELGSRGAGWARLERVYVVLVLLAASSAAITWAFLDPSRILSVVTAVLVVTCPCALGLATPLAFDLALARLRNAGIFVRTKSLLAKAVHVKRVFFDKTGTLTWGKLRALPDRDGTPLDRSLAFTLASSSNHPRSTSIRTRYEDGGDVTASFLTDLTVREVPGAGLEARLDGKTVRLGAPGFAAAHDAARLPRDRTVLGIDGHARIGYAFEEEDRPGIARELAALRAFGIDCWLLSGDQKARVATAAKRLGFEDERALGELSPEDKARIVREHDHDDSLMLGDGLNDGPALEAAFCAGTPAVDRPVLPARCDFYYCGIGSGAVLATLSLATEFRRVVRTNLTLAGLYNAFVLVLSFQGRMSPLVCAIVMPVSSILLVTHTIWRLRRHAPAVTRRSDKVEARGLLGRRVSRIDARRMPDDPRPTTTKPPAAGGRSAWT